MLQIALTRYGTLDERARLFTRRQVVSLITAACRVYTCLSLSLSLLSLYFCFFSRQFVIIHRRSIPRTRRVSLVKSSNEYRSRWTLSGNLPIRLPLLRVVYVTYMPPRQRRRRRRRFLAISWEEGVIDRLNRACHAYRTQSGQPAISYLNHGQLTNHPFIHYLGDRLLFFFFNRGIRVFTLIFGTRRGRGRELVESSWSPSSRCWRILYEETACFERDESWDTLCLCVI